MCVFTYSDYILKWKTYIYTFDEAKPLEKITFSCRLIRLKLCKIEEKNQSNTSIRKHLKKVLD